MLVADEPQPYHPQEYFAFVEDEEPLDSRMFESDRDQWWAPIVRERNQLDLAIPARLVWLDCVSANYFRSLPWRDEICRIGDSNQSERRRRLIMELDPSQFIIAPLFLSVHELETSFDEADWHRVFIGKDGGLPVLTSADYDFDVEGAPSELRYLLYEAECSEPERISLRNVFNLNFLPDASIDEDEEPINWKYRPQKPQPTPELKYAGYSRGLVRR